MLISEYLNGLTKTISEYTRTGLILSSELTTDYRTSKIGYIKGALSFPDDSKLFFKEYIDLRYGIVRETYSYHYQNGQGELLFRYDNANHRPSLGFIDHKHTDQTIIPSDIPQLSNVLEEIIDKHISDPIG